MIFSSFCSIFILFLFWDLEEDPLFGVFLGSKGYYEVKDSPGVYIDHLYATKISQSYTFDYTFDLILKIWTYLRRRPSYRLMVIYNSDFSICDLTQMLGIGPTWPLDCGTT